MTLIKKPNGEVVEFNPDRVFAVCRRLGVSKKIANSVVSSIASKLKDSDTTKRIAELVREALPLPFSLLYGLREAVAALGPAKFELYVGRVLTANGYTCITNVIVKGEVIEHEVDVIAAKGNNIYMIECKHHINPHRDCGLDNVLQLQATLEDINAGYWKKQNQYNFTRGWLVTNTRFSEHARRYAAAKNITLSGWREGNLSLTRLIEQKKAFPVTMLQLPANIIAFCIQHNILTTEDFILNANMIYKKSGRKIVKQALTQIGSL